LSLIELEFIKALQSGDEFAFTKLVEENQQLVYNTAVGIIQSAEDAEDIAQEVFVQAFESIKTFKGDSKISTWLYRITVTKSLDRVKYKNRKKTGGLIVSIFSRSETFNDVPDFYHPGVQLVDKERSVILFKALSMLPDTQRVAFTLHKVEGLSQVEIAEIMQCTVSSVESLMHRAKQGLKKLLSDYYKNS
jgi:RNA polymerase sigma factor (sigma-70 family)